LDWNWRGTEAKTQILLRNDAQCRLTVGLEMMKVQNRLGDALPTNLEHIPLGPIAIPSGAEEIVTLKVSLKSKTNILPAAGFIKVISTPETPACKPVPKTAPPSNTEEQESKPVPAHDFYEVVIPEGPWPGVAGYVFALSLVVAGLLVLAAIFHPEVRKAGMIGQAAQGGPTWDFQKSWGVNIALAGGLLGVLMTWTFPEHPRLLTKISATTLSALFTILVTLAPLVYGLFSGVKGKASVRVALLSAGLVLWGAFGQTVMLVLLVCDFVQGSVLDPLVGGILIVLAGLLGVLLVFYGWDALYQTASVGPPPSTTMVVAPPQGVQETPPVPVTPKWSLP
jgi:hypothetical protein